MKVFYFPFILSFIFPIQFGSAQGAFSGDRRPGIMDAPEVTSAPTSRDVKRAEELQKLQQMVEGDNELGPVPSDLDPRDERELPTAEAI